MIKQALISVSDKTGVLDFARALSALGVNILFAGDESVIQPLLPARDERFSILHAPEVVSMEDTPAEAVRRKKNSSLVQGIHYYADPARGTAGLIHPFIDAYGPADIEFVLAFDTDKRNRRRFGA